MLVGIPVVKALVIAVCLGDGAAVLPAGDPDAAGTLAWQWVRVSGGGRQVADERQRDRAEVDHSMVGAPAVGRVDDGAHEGSGSAGGGVADPVTGVGQRSGRR
ncbi:MAG: hypothetical protein JOZ53_10025 [Planctomycetaceae bacterium]|nr:hypothetical protein [Planctomycetaceae bacterium]